jgi:hypothetical protein
MARIECYGKPRLYPHNGVATIQQFIDGTYQGESKIKHRYQVY